MTTTWTSPDKTAINHERYLESGDIRVTEGSNIRTLEDKNTWWNGDSKNSSSWSQITKNNTTWTSPTAN